MAKWQEWPHRREAPPVTMTAERRQHIARAWVQLSWPKRDVPLNAARQAPRNAGMAAPRAQRRTRRIMIPIELETHAIDRLRDWRQRSHRRAQDERKDLAALRFSWPRSRQASKSISTTSPTPLQRSPPMRGSGADSRYGYQQRDFRIDIADSMAHLAGERCRFAAARTRMLPLQSSAPSADRADPALARQNPERPYASRSGLGRRSSLMRGRGDDQLCPHQPARPSRGRQR